ncbi:hypothetical protein LWI29_015412 [Acer saccharum]|uniref:Bidirectional sugar transporter SWEET n=1 Tax=Acer saccharum TaxID=4024 RepID=A0AA39T276_ACESA|nr:hypothetical protein LWI29_015412 [Acer saccharum]
MFPFPPAIPKLLSRSKSTHPSTKKQLLLSIPFCHQRFFKAFPGVNHKALIEDKDQRERELKRGLMIVTLANQFIPLLQDAAGIAGNIFAFGLFLSPIPTFRRIIRNHATEQFSGLPYIYALLSCLITMWYGTPLISIDNISVLTVNSIGAAFQLVYVTLYIAYSEKEKKVRLFGLILAVLVIFAIVVVGSLQIDDIFLRRIFVGILSSAALISMFASPLFVINLVIRTKSVEFMPFYLSLSTFLMSTSFFVYGILNMDIFVYIPNGMGTVLGIVQLVLYFYYKRSSREESRVPLIVSYS